MIDHTQWTGTIETYSPLFVDRKPEIKFQEALKDKNRELSTLVRFNMKIIKKNSLQLEQILVLSYPWKGWFFLPKNCIMCEKTNIVPGHEQ